AGPELRRLEADGDVVEGGFRPGGGGREWITPDVLRRVRRRTLAAIRRAVEPVEADALGRFLPAWQGVGRDAGRGIDRLRDVVAQLQGVPIPVPPGSRPSCRCACPATGRTCWTSCA